MNEIVCIIYFLLEFICVYFRYCRDPASVKPFKWDDDITKWPVSKLLYI